MTQFHALIPCAGTGSRAGTVQPKQYQLIAGQPMVMHTVQALAQESRAVVLLEAPHRIQALAQALAVLGEEFGELTKDVLQMTYEPGKTNAENVRKEAIQTAAMALRFVASLDAYIYKCVEVHEPNLLKLDIVRASKRPSKSKVVAYLYQNAETQAMTKAYEFLKSKKIGVLAKIHDAFIVRKQLTQAVKQELEELVQFETHNEYWRLGEKPLKRWGDLMTQEEKQRIAQHKAFIANEVEYMREKAKQRKQ